MSAVLGLPPDVLSVSQRFVLLSYANHCNKDGLSFPGHGTVAAETGLSERTVGRATQELRAMRLLKVAAWPTRGEDGKYKGSVVYTLNIPGLPPTAGHSVRRSIGQGDRRTDGQTVGHGVGVTNEPKKRRSRSFPQDISSVLDGMDLEQR